MDPRPLPFLGMRFRTRSFGALCLALLTALVAGAAPAQTGADLSSRAHRISNVATIEWEADGRRLSLESNRVDIAVEGSEVPLSLSLFRFAANSQSVAMTVTPSRCRTTGRPVELSPAFAELPLSPAQAIPTGAIRSGEPFLFRIDAPAANRHSAAVDTIEVLVEAPDGDREILLVYESAPGEGRFAGLIQTVRAGPGEPGDCRLSVKAGDRIHVSTLGADHQTVTASADLDVLADPFGYVFDSRDGRVVSGARVTIVDAATGQPATVFGDDGASAYPATVTSGGTVTDAGGAVYTLAPGLYRFPLMRPGSYRLTVEPPAGYSAPSVRTPAELGGLRRPDGQPYALDAAASFGGALTLDGPEPVHISIPLDPPAAALLLSKQASRAEAVPGETIQYRVALASADAERSSGHVTLTDRFAPALRLRPETLRLDGRPVAADADTGGFRLAVPPIPAGATVSVTYALEVRGDAKAGDAMNRAEASDERGTKSNVAEAAVRIRRELIAGRMTIVGRVAEGGCAVSDKEARGVAGVRVMLEDGTYSVTDADGRYHFEGLKPGTHVVQLDDMTIPTDRAAVECRPSTRSAGRAFSRFVEGRGGGLKRVDFRLAEAPARLERKTVAAERPKPASDAAAAGAEREWLAGETPGIAWLFPEPEHNPRAPLVRVEIKHLPGQKVTLLSGGRPVDPVAYEGSRKDPGGTMAVSLWRGIPLEKGETRLSAEVRNGDGSLAETLRRTIRYGAAPIRAELVRGRSVLVADGVTRPVLAVRLTDGAGRPVRHGLTGEFELPAPYYPAVEADAQQARQLAGLERARPFWRVEGEDGLAFVELEPTTASGTVSLRFSFRDGETVREQRLEAWLDPGERPWTIVGLAEGTAGYNRLSGRVEDLGDEEETLLADGRLALYAKGRVRGKWLMTLAYDSDRKEDEARFGGVIDPDAYYTVYADRSEQRYDAASVRKLYLKLERPQFYALFGDYETGIDEPELARYVRAFNGLKAEYRSDRVSATAFAADSPHRHRHDEIQGNGLSGPYALGARDIVANSERISIEVRDRLRSDRIVERRLLTRHIDYDIDYRAGTLRFREPILSRSSALDPQFIVADYEVDGVASRSLSAGGRAAWRSADDKLQVAATAIRDSDAERTAGLVGVDVRYRPSPETEIRAEAAMSDNEAKAGAAAPAAGTATAWQVEAEHHGERFDVLAYAREREAGFGLGQLGAAEAGTRKFGLDARARFGDSLSLTGSAWHEDYLGSPARRIAARALVEYRRPDLSGRVGLTFADDRLADGREARSTLLQLGASKRLFDNKLELDAQTEIPLGGSDESIDFPARHRLAARYAVTTGVQLVGTYEIADGEHVDARTARIGFDLSPWAGGRIAVSGNVQDIAEYGPRSFAAFGLSQSLVLDAHWSVDFTVDANKTLSGIDPSRVLNPLHPVASGGHVGGAGLTEDFTAVTAGATYRADLWSATARAEYRAGEEGDRYGLTAAALRQIGDGQALGGSLSWFAAEGPGGAETRVAHAQMSWAYRPAGSAWSWLDKLELREDRVAGAVAGLPGPIGIPFGITGDARSRRVVNSLSINWTSEGEGTGFGLSEASIFWGTRYASERFGDEDVGGWSNALGADLRFDVGGAFDIGLAGTVRHGAGARSFSWSAGPNVGVTPFENGWLSIGWNVAGFHDRDFSDARYTRSGPYVTMRLKFDQMSLQDLGLVP